MYNLLPTYIRWHIFYSTYNSHLFLALYDRFQLSSSPPISFKDRRFFKFQHSFHQAMSNRSPTISLGPMITHQSTLTPLLEQHPRIIVPVMSLTLCTTQPITSASHLSTSHTGLAKGNECHDHVLLQADCSNTEQSSPTLAQSLL